MRKRLASGLLICTVAAGMLSGCGFSTNSGKTYKVSELTDDQKTVLQGSSWLIDEEELSNDEINYQEQDILEKYDVVIAYLQEKYPDHEVQVTGYSGRGGEADVSVSYRFDFIFIEYPDETCTVSVGKKNITDNGFDTVRINDYKEILTEYLSDLDETVLQIDGGFGFNNGMFDTTLSIESYFVPEYYEAISSLCNIYIDSKGRTESECKESFKEIQEFFTEHNIYGSTKIFYTEAVNGEYSTDKDNVVYSEIFNVWEGSEE